MDQVFTSNFFSPKYREWYGPSLDAGTYHTSLWGESLNDVEVL